MTPARWQRVKETLASAMERSAQERDPFLAEACADDTALLREVESLLNQSAEAFDAWADTGGFIGSEASQNVGRRIGAYGLVRELGRGGMGTVWLARRADEQFEQQVAIKLLKRGTDTDEVLRRFRGERQILARLNHPNIARLFDAGTTDDGLPYFVMEYVEGRHLTDFARERNLPVKERVRLFLKICAAVQFAHQNLVVHRDLKPANIVVTDEGEPKLLDFGIAKLIAADGDEWLVTAAGRERLTPAYASPEQVRGEAITTMSDVYALGALLYELLCGRPAHDVEGNRPSPAELLRVVCEQEVVRPSLTSDSPELRRQLRGDLDNIVLRALAKAPERRYASAGNLGEDLRRYLDGRPVRARPDTLGYRARKFIVRNKTASIAALVVTATLLTSVILTGYAAMIARRERAQAERRFHELRRLANSFLFELNDAIETRPTEARKLLVQRAREYLDSLSGDAREDLSLRADLAAAYQKLGDVESQLNQANIGDTSGALDDYRKALALRESLFATDAARQQDTRARFDLARSYGRLADVLAKTGDTAAALASYEKELPLLEIASADSSDPERRRALASAYEIIGRTLYRTGNISGAIAHYQQSLAEIDSLAREENADSAAQLEQAKTFTSFGYLLAETGKAEEALQYYRKNLGIVVRLAEADPQNATLRRRVMEAHEWIANSLRDQNEFAAALAEYDQSEKLCRSALRADPANVQTRNDLADVYHNIGRARYRAGDAVGALQDFRTARDYYHSVAEADPLNIHAERQTLMAESEVGQALALGGDPDTAAASLRDSLQGFHQLAERDPKNTEFAADEASGEAAFADVLARLGQKTDAAEHLRNACRMFSAVTARAPLNATFRDGLVRAQSELANLERAQ